MAGVSIPLCGPCRGFHDILDAINDGQSIARTHDVFTSRRALVTSGGVDCIACDFFRQILPPPLSDYQLYEIRLEDGLEWDFPVPKGTALFRLMPVFSETGLDDYQRYEFFYHSSEDRPSTNGSSLPIPQVVDYTRIKEGLVFCKEQHGDDCAGTRRPEISDLRVIDCSNRGIVDWDSLEHTSSYLTLSYVWGQSSAIEQTSGNRIPTHAPKVIDDAIEVTLNLGYRYLWVDRYCIPIDHAAKHAQLRNMGDIYSNSDLTIIAAAGHGPGTGLPGTRTTPRKGQISTTIGRHKLCMSPPGINWEIESSRWNKRGWTYQEAFLSRRQLVFTKSETYFQCRQLHYPEQVALPSMTWRIPFVKPSVEQVKTFAASSVFRPLTTQLPCTKFSTMVNEYSMRELTFETDILDAFKGILRAFESLEAPVQNLCGVPLYSLDLPRMTNTDALVYGLSWNPAPIGMPLHAELWRKMMRRKGFPSWSWIGWQLSRKLAYHFHLWPLSEILSERGFALNDDVFEALVHVGVGFSDGSVAPWESERYSILHKYHTGVTIQFLELAGLPAACGRLGLWRLKVDVMEEVYGS
ncbi:hypothetical protein CDV36_003908 [Fusarium kuroshium]|uniref:Heterokaryon incompatibility domain-containing protein n=1 Tax=Fusarium kuroshium TaxID=2010991 RepID=A0A3M2SFY8_9HYPO|nr:hypothetical protein CDV36_003908 [Fusarium kuroshium]